MNMQQRLLEALGQRDPLDALGATSGVLSELIRDYGPDAFTRRHDPEKWSPGEIISHLVDHECVMAVRIRRVLGEDRPVLNAYPQEDWVAGRTAGAVESDVEAFDALRTINLNLWTDLSDAQMDRVGLHATRGEEPLSMMLRLHAGHDLVHLDQLSRYLEAID